MAAALRSETRKSLSVILLPEAENDGLNGPGPAKLFLVIEPSGTPGFGLWNFLGGPAPATTTLPGSHGDDDIIHGGGWCSLPL